MLPIVLDNKTQLVEFSQIERPSQYKQRLLHNLHLIYQDLQDTRYSRLQSQWFQTISKLLQQTLPSSSNSISLKETILITHLDQELLLFLLNLMPIDLNKHINTSKMEAMDKARNWLRH